jgi:AraC-like DNA-binding protein
MDIRTWLAIGVFLSVFLTLLIFSKGQKHRSDGFLASWLLIIGLHLLFYLNNIYYYSPALEWLYVGGFALSLVHAPLLFLYVCASVGEQRFSSRPYLHFIPYVAFSIIVFVLQINGLGAIRYGFLVWKDTPPGILRYYGLLFAFSGVAYPLWSFFVLRNYQKQVVPQYFSFTDRVNFNWLKYWVAASLLVFVVIFVLITASIDLRWLSPAEVFQWVGLATVTHLVYVGFFGIRQTTLFSSYQVITELPQKKPVGKEPSRMHEEAARRLSLFMEKEKPYLDPELTLPALAERMQLKTHELSAVINNHFNRNFYRFINTYRVEEFKKRLASREAENLKILSVAYDCGFNSKSTFNKVFQEITGMTPSRFRESLQYR